MREAIETVEDVIGKGLIHVMDRDEDRQTLIDEHLHYGGYFIIHQIGKRTLFCENKKRSLNAISRQTPLVRKISVTKVRKGKVKPLTFDYGSHRVFFPKDKGWSWDIPLWFVVAKQEGQGYVWYLSHLPTDTADGAISLTMEGYGSRWKIEEVHRHFKVDYHLKEIMLHEYHA